MNEKTRRIISMALLLAALGMFIAFHFLATYDKSVSTVKGWEWWWGYYNWLRQPENLGPWFGIGMSSFFMFALLITATPFLFKVWPRSRIAWCFATVFSGFSAVGFTLWTAGGNVSDMSMLGYGMSLGGWLAVTAPYLNFLGLVLARRWREEPRNSPIPPPDSP